jgi:hypothetical protein
VLKVITTRYGQLVAKVNKEQQFTQILDEDMQPVATVRQVTKEGVVKAINQIASFLARKRLLQENGIKLEAGAERLESIDADSFTEDEEAATPNVVESASEDVPALPGNAPAITDEPEAANPPRQVKQSGRPKGSGAKRGRKPGQKVKRNPELTW